jgi:hypothetical protein
VDTPASGQPTVCICLGVALLLSPVDDAGARRRRSRGGIVSMHEKMAPCSQIRIDSATLAPLRLPQRDGLVAARAGLRR